VSDKRYVLAVGIHPETIYLIGMIESPPVAQHYRADNEVARVRGKQAAERQRHCYVMDAMRPVADTVRIVDPTPRSGADAEAALRARLIQMGYRPAPELECYAAEITHEQYEQMIAEADAARLSAGRGGTQ